MKNMAKLPVPEIVEETCFQHFTQNSKKDDSNFFRPPKRRLRLLHDTNFNRSITSASESCTSAQAVSFREDLSVVLSKSYNETLNESYFEQCFTNISKLGEGSFGEVFKVRSKEDGLYYAVKMSKQFYRSEQYRQERLEEVRRYEQFSGHANCLRFHRAWEENDRLYMQMELCKESLECYAERCFPTKIPEEKVWSILLDLLLALKSLHDRNLIHLDIKLDNVLIANDGTCKLADFGLVIDVDRANRCQATEGDSRYMAPEILQGNFSKSADIFSLGIAILELSCYLKLPQNGPLWQQLRSGNFPEDFMQTLSPELCAIIKEMMTPDPLARPSVNALLTHRKFIDMLKNRRVWKLGRQFLSWWRTLCLPFFMVYQIKAIAVDFFNNVRNRLMLNSSKHHKLQIPAIGIQCTPKQSPNHSFTPAPNFNPLNIRFLGDSHHKHDARFTHTYQSTPINNVDSTPVNCSQYSFRSRKDLTKISFRRDSISDLEKSSDFSSALLSLEDQKSICGKRLFDDGNNDESD